MAGCQEKVLTIPGLEQNGETYSGSNIYMSLPGILGVSPWKEKGAV